MFRVWMLLLAAVLPIRAEEGPAPLNMIPMDYVQIQHGGNMGALSVGIGNRFFGNRYALEIHYGYTPRMLSEVAISTLSIRNTLTPVRLEVLGHRFEPYIGLGWIYSFNQRYNPNWADEVPDDYYYQYAFHFSLYGGLSAMHPIPEAPYGITALGAYVEAGTLDTYLVSYFSEPGTLGIDDITNISFGIRAEF